MEQIDTLYNHIGSAIFNLGSHIAGQGDKISQEHQEAVNIFFSFSAASNVLIGLQYTTCILDLNRLLDVEHPWVMIVKDPSGLSEFTSNDDVLLLDA